MVPNTPPPPSDKEKEAHENAGEDQKGGPKLLLNILNDGWISVRERLPEEGVVVSASNGSNSIAAWRCMGHFVENGFSTRLHYDVTHWQPLPSPPKNP